MTTSDTCPHCKANLRGEEIPEALRPSYPPNVTHYSRREPVRNWSGSFNWGRTVGWLCPDCKRRID